MTAPPRSGASRATSSAACWYSATSRKRKRAEASLKAQQDRVQMVADAVPSLISYIDVDAHYRLNNQAYEAWFGHPRGELIGRHMRDVLGESAWAAIRPHVKAALAGQVVSYEAEVPYRDGGTRWIMATYTPDFGDGAVQGVVAHVTDISALKRAEQQVAMTLESVTDGFMRYDRDWRIVYVNAEAERINQLTRSEMLGQILWEVFPGVVGTKLESEFRRTVGEQVTVEFENYYAPFGRWYSLKCYPTPDGGLTTYIRDITEKKQAEEQLRESEERFRGIFSQTVAGVAQTDMTGRFVLVNQRYTEIVGRSAEELTGLRMQDITHPDDLLRNLPLFKAMVDEGKPFVITKRYVRPDGSHVWVSNSVSLVRDGDGRPKYVVAVVLDITEQRRIEEELRQSEQRLEVVLRSINDHFVTYDREWRFTYVNDRAAAILGRPKDELLGRCIWELFPDAVGNPYYVELHRAFSEQRGIRLEHFYAPFDAWLENHIYPSADGVSVFAADITDRKRAEDVLRRSEARFRCVFESNVVGMIQWDLDRSLILDANDEFLRMTGYTRDDVAAGRLNFRDMTPAEWTARNEEGIRAIREDGHATPYEKEYFRKDGSRVPLIIAGTRFDDSPCEGMSLLIDISERKWAEQQIARLAAESDRQRRLYETILTNTPDLMYVFSLDHKVLYANDALIKMWGRGYEDVIGKTLLEIGYEPGHAEMHDREIDQVRATRQPIRGEVPFHGSNGRRQYEYIFVPVIGADGEVEAVAGTTRDVTERKEAEWSIRAGEERLRTALTAAHMVAWEWTPVDGKLRMSENAVDVFGLPAGVHLTGINEGLALLHPDDLTTYQATFQKAINERGSYLTRYRLIRPEDGRTIWIEERGHAVFDQPGGEGRLFGVATDVTASVQADVERERLLQQMEGERERLADVFRQAPAFMCVLRGPSHVFEMANERYYALVGHRDLLGKTVSEVLPEVVEQGFIALLDGVYETGEPFVGTGVRILLEQAGEQYVDFVYQALRDSDGHVDGIMVVGVEVTARHKAEEALRLSEERFRTLFETMDEGFCVVEMEFDDTGRATDYQIVMMNPAFEKHTGIQGLAGKSIRQALPGLEEFWYETYGRVASTGEKVNFVHQAGPMGGRSFDVSAFPFGGVGSPLVAILFNDITDRKKVEAALRENEERFREMANAAPAMIWVTNEKHECTFLSKSWFDLTGQKNEKGHGFGRFNAVHPDDREAVQLTFISALKKGEAFELDYRLRTRDGNYRWAIDAAKPRFNEAGDFCGFVGSVTDAHDRHEFQLALNEALVAAESANESKSAFLANMSHEIRTPMTAILGYADLLKDLVHQDDAIQHLQTIRNNGYYLLEIINDILDISKIEAGKLDVQFERFQPHRLIEDVRSIMEIRATEGGLKLEVQYDGKLPNLIQSDAKRLKQILINLVGNAIKFTHNGRVQMLVRFDIATRRLQFDVIDTGIGISSDQMDRLFKPFSQGDASVSRNFGGTGLGLIISQRLAEMLGGAITANSTQGVGSKFSFSIPTGENAELELVDYESISVVSGGQAESGLNEPTKLSCHVLIVDDRRDIRFLSKHILTKAGATVKECEDGLIAVEHISACLADGNWPDLILLDMQMPNLDGYATAQQVRSLGYTGPIVALTADAMQSDMNKCLEVGCNDYLSKPIDKAQLLKKVAELTKGVNP
jgi:PAS domain S-box-containing protein